MPKENLTFDDLTPLEQGCVDCIIDCERNGDRQAEWQGLGREAFAPETLRAIVADCDVFLAVAAGSDSAFEDHLFAEVDAYELGRHLHLERQCVGVGFSDLLIEEPLLGRLLKASAPLGTMAFHVGEDGLVRLSSYHSSPSTPTI